MATEQSRGPGNFDNLLTSTLQEFREGLNEQWVQNNVVLKHMEKESKDLIDGGISIVENLEYDDNSTVGWTGRTGTVSVAEDQFLTQARFIWATIVGAVSIYDHDLAQNTGKNALFNLFEAKTKNLQRTFDAQLETALLASSTSNVNTINTLYDIVDSADPSLGSLGDIARATYTWWAATETASGSMATQGLEDIRTASATVSRSGSDPVNLHICTQTLYTAYQARLTPMERLQARGKGDAEFDSLTFGGKPVEYSFAAQSGIWLGLNTKYLRFRLNKHMNFLNQPFVRGEGKQYKSSIVQTQCQATTTRPKSMFKLTGMTA